VRRHLNDGQTPPAAAVRIEELINYFPYDYPTPSADAPFSVNVEIAGCPWQPDHRLARIGLRGRDIPREAHPGANLVFLIDVSGSMDEPKKLPLVKSALSLLVQQLDGRDEVAIVTYAGSSGVALPATLGDRKAEILDAINALQPGGGTNGQAGLQLAYKIARGARIKGGINRVILATDGDFNLGITDHGELIRFIEAQAKQGVSLTALGFGMGNYKDDTLERLADHGDGNYGYVDGLTEARKILLEQMTGTLATIAKDVKIQVEFNPAQVGAYRLIGYENRMLHKEEFNDDRKDAGDIGAGHTVTALYEITPAGGVVGLPDVDPLKYQQPGVPSDAAGSGEMLTLKLRYKRPEGGASLLLTSPVVDEGSPIEASSPEFRFAAAVAAFGMILRESPQRGGASFEMVKSLASDGIGNDAAGYRAEFSRLIDRAESLSSR
jgi:Ca-activated chloride channel homolog